MSAIIKYCFSIFLSPFSVYLSLDFSASVERTGMSKKLVTLGIRLGSGSLDEFEIVSNVVLLQVDQLDGIVLPPLFPIYTTL